MKESVEDDTKESVGSGEYRPAMLSFKAFLDTQVIWCSPQEIFYTLYNLIKFDAKK